MNIFDNLQVSTFNTVLACMGYTCTWLPSAGGSLKTANVLFKTPTDDEKEASVNYELVTGTIEYKEGDLAGLKEAADNNIREIINIDGVDHIVLSVSKKFDGKTFEARLKNL
jgi:uncharacterized protein YaaQ